MKEIKPAAVLITGWSLPPLIYPHPLASAAKGQEGGTLRAQEQKVVKNNDNVCWCWRAAKKSNYVASVHYLKTLWKRSYLFTMILMVMDEDDGVRDDGALMVITRHVGRQRASC